MSVSAGSFEHLLSPALAAASAQQCGQLAQYLALVDEYRGVLNLTAFSRPEELALELVVESARLLEFGALPAGLRCVDLGSGVGSPVVTLAVLCPQASFVAVESRQRRAAFLRQVCAALRLSNIEVWGERAELLAEREPGSFGLVTARAFAQPAVLMRLALALLAPEGELRGFYGAQLGEVELAANAAGLRVGASRAYEQRGLQRHIYSARRAI
jgi:16S rRNA (guanine527-N7)-methyltransferase